MSYQEVMALKKVRGRWTKITNINKLLYSYKNFEKIFELYNEMIILVSTKDFLKVLKLVYQRYWIDKQIVPFLRSMTVRKYFNSIPEEYFKKNWFEKVVYMSLITSSINEKEKWLYFKQLEAIPKIKKEIVTAIDWEIKKLSFYMARWLRISYFIITKVIPQILWINSLITINLSPSYIILYSIFALLIALLLWRLSFTKYKTVFINAFLKVKLLRDMTQALNIINLLTIFLIGQFSNINIVMWIYNKMFPYIREKDNPWSKKTLIDRILLDPEKNKYFSISWLIILAWINDKWTNDIIDTLNIQTEWYVQYLKIKVIKLKAIVSNVWLWIIWITVMWPALALVGMMSWMLSSMKNIWSGGG
jgi:hypothetical protein